MQILQHENYVPVFQAPILPLSVKIYDCFEKLSSVADPRRSANKTNKNKNVGLLPVFFATKTNASNSSVL